MDLKQEIKICLEDSEHLSNILGYQDRNLRLLEKGLDADIVVRGDTFIINGTDEDVKNAKSVIEHLISLSYAGVNIQPLAIEYAVKLKGDIGNALAEKLAMPVYTNPKGKIIRAKTVGQWYYLEEIKHHDLTFGIGPAGTGKTYLAVVMAVAALKKKQVNRIVLARPAVEAGEKLGFLPGDMQEKVNPYLRPVYDGLYDLLGKETAEKYMERGIIEVVPLAYMRGRTLEDAFIILDEAQNTTSQQMKMFLTRLGLGSKAVITGDITQIDLPNGQASGLIEAERRLKDINEIAFCYFSEMDVVRHPLVQKIIKAYERKWI